MAAARTSLDVAIYDLVLQGPPRDLMAKTLSDLKARGVCPRVVYNVDYHARSHNPPPQMIVVPHDLLQFCDARPVPGQPDLMHQKYVIRDGEAVWTGSTNWTNDSWSLEENVIVTVAAGAVAAAYQQDFEDLWSTRVVENSGRYRPDWIELAAGSRVRPYFTPFRARKLVHEIAQRLSTARRRVRICSPVLTSGPILATLAEMVQEGVKADVKGVFDATQMAEVRAQWQGNPLAAWKLTALDQVLRGIPFTGKASTPWGQGTAHDFMHAKCVVCDDHVFVGSYNLSHSGEDNAENVLEFEDAALADRFAAFIDSVVAAYPPVVVPLIR